MRPVARTRLLALAIVSLVLTTALPARAFATPARPRGEIERAIATGLSGLDPAELRTGVLLDRVLPLAHVERFDGSLTAPALDLATFRQACDELTRSGAATSASAAWFEGAPDPHVIPLVVVDVAWERIAPDAFERGAMAWRDGRLVRGAGSAYNAGRSFLAGPLADRTWHGGDLAFTLDREHVVSDVPTPFARVEIDPGDGLGWRAIRFGGRVTSRYATTGPRTVRVRVTRADGRVVVSSATLLVAAVSVPAPDETLHVTAATPYLGVAGTGRGYVYRAVGHPKIVNPVIMIEGFDLDNSMGWDQLYTLLSQQGLLDTLHTRGFDAVVLDFTDATDHLQRNAGVVETLIGQVRDSLPAGHTIALVGASMGGLLGRYALADMETHGIPHRVRTFVSFDAPHAGADIPLGIQYWMQFFAGQSTSAATLLAELDRPAARQMLVYHLTSPPSAAAPDPLRATLLGDLAAVGGFPALPRTVAIANGSGSRVGQGFAPGDQLIRYEYGSLFVTLKGNVWALPQLTTKMVFDGRISIVLIQNTTQTVSVTNTQAFDSAPGGWRSSMTQMDTTTAPYGDIVALYPHHCFIPTVSALALDTSDLLYDIAGDSNLLAHTPFDAVYFPAEDQEHVAITAQNAAWFLDEIEAGLTGVGDAPVAPLALAMSPAAPNPSRGASRLRFVLPAAGAVELTVFDVSGRRVRTLIAGPRPAGAGEISWDGRDETGHPVRAGLYLARLRTGAGARTGRLVRLD